MVQKFETKRMEPLRILCMKIGGTISGTAKLKEQIPILKF
jgi:hypothetical protein